MTYKTKSILWWIFSIIFTLSIAYYQRTTGPTYPVRGKIEINDQVYKYKLLTSNDSDKPAQIYIKGEDSPNGITAFASYRKFKSNDEWIRVDFKPNENKLLAELPQQPPAGKLSYRVVVESNEQIYYLTEEPVVIRFKGPVPGYVLYPHILLMFLAMLFSTRTGIETLIKGGKTFSYAKVTLIFLLFGGMILGPVVQKYAFGEFWTGWPFGQDLTDNKTLVAFVAWIIAVIRLRKDREKRGWALVAAIILLAVYLIPHSMFGSELDYSTGEIGTGK